jgi:hypothetical protein
MWRIISGRGFVDFLVFPDTGHPTEHATVFLEQALTVKKLKLTCAEGKKIANEHMP